uniref:Putative rRNA methyltransferase n=1 Tax=Dermatophagoides pteronyssinus TaxID=6956 RepID=A0A6P6Y7L1_DERPT
MGKKGKVGKQRKDKYYQLAKETGYRSRASFKLIQLNRKFEFLQRSKVLIDLCAAPGGWLQVAQKYMPVSSVIIGVDLVPIKPIHNVITLQEDITTQKCRMSLKKNLQTWKADVVLNDGAPNVGKSWIHDAFEQNRLTLSALHLACDFLVKGGWFITKVFRSKDYNALIWVLNKFFKKVFATKPQASRNESAEIFVVCQNFIAPDRIDPKFFDPTYVFAELQESEQKLTTNDLLKASMKQKKAKAEGYDDGQINLYRKLNASDFIANENYADLLSKSSEIVINNDYIRNHPATTDEIVECCKDIKVLGRKELLLLINWRRTINNEMKNLAKKFNKDSEEKENNLDIDDKENHDVDKDDDDDDDEVEEIDSFENEEAIKMKRIKKKMAKEKRKLTERMNLKMVLENDQLVQEEQDLFSLTKIRKNLDKIKDVDPDIVLDDNDNNDDDDDGKNSKQKKIYYDKDEKYLDSEDELSENDDDDDNQDSDQNDFDNDNVKNEKENGVIHFDLDDEDGDDNGNDLIVDLEDHSMDVKSERFFDKPIFKDFEDDEEIELEEIENFLKKSDNKKDEEQNLTKLDNEEESEDDDDDDDDEVVKKEENQTMTNGLSKKMNRKEKAKRMLSPEELTMATAMIHSKKSKRDLIDDSWNRYMNNDLDGAPSWFKREEEQHCRKPMPVSKEFAKQSITPGINSRQNKKEMEAKARKKKRTMRRLEKARIKAETLTEDPSMSNKEKADTIRRIYKRASTKNEKRPKLVVAKKQYGNRRPPGVKGRYKIVDSRMKKDKRKQQQNERKTGKGKKKFRKPKK